MTKLWIGTQPDPSERTIIEISDSDFKAYAALDRHSRRSVRVIDLITGQPCRIRRADCGLGCRCAAEFVGKPPQRKTERSSRETHTDEQRQVICDNCKGNGLGVTTKGNAYTCTDCGGKGYTFEPLTREELDEVLAGEQAKSEGLEGQYK